MALSKTIVAEYFRHTKGLGGHRLLEYAVVSEKTLPTSTPHIVKEYFDAGSQDWPNIHRHATVEEARETWRRLKRALLAQGYISMTAKSNA